MNHILPQMIPAVCFAVFIGLGNTIDLETAVIAMIYFEKLQWCQNWFPTFLTEYSELNIAFDRIKKFMSIKNVQTNFKTVKKIKGEYALKIKGNFSWGFSDKVNETVNKNTQLRFNKDDKRKLKQFIQLCFFQQLNNLLIWVLVERIKVKAEGTVKKELDPEGLQ